MAEADAFRDAVRAALADPLGGALGRLFTVPAVTALVADGRDEALEVIALDEALGALDRVGVPRGRQFVLLAHAGEPGDACRALRARMRAALEVPVLAHDAARGATWSPGAFGDGRALVLDDDLREAEEVVLVGACARDAALGVRGGPATLWPGLADAPGRAAHLGSLPAGAAARAAVSLARAREALAHVPAALGVWWPAHEPLAVRAGASLALLAACEADGWFGK